MVWSDFIHVVEAWIVRVVIFTSDVEKNQRRHFYHHLRQKRLQRIHQSPAHRKLFISLRIYFLRKMTKSSLLERRRIVEYDVIASEFLNLFSRCNRIFCDYIRSKLINLFFRTSSMYGSEYQWFELKKIRSVLMKTENIEFYSVVVSRATSLFDIVLSRYFMYEKNQYSISIVFFWSFHVQVANDQYEAVRQWCRESQNRFSEVG